MISILKKTVLLQSVTVTPWNRKELKIERFEKKFELAEQFKAEYKNQLGTDFPSDPVEQLKLAIEAVFRSWDNPRANVYRRDNDIPYSWEQLLT